ncbi:glycosyltransferase family 2 protein [Marilutibacter aestuarii]|uniref:Glycosyltransferase family 2 protein n=1 Tax=Marilutibacter aestuarii TaxID=1706195 RepID=A0A507ZRG8_9GAMM|nr:glycosyltransferase family 2 protein [Lysobacter aestuarii]TQD39969.1 glycosyltransferase family 2 protein [Lysobacter aestuarii]
MSRPSPEAGIAAVVVTYRSLETIDECLQRLRRADGVVEIRVVDNGSDDGTVDILQRHALQDPRVRFIANPDNPGFAVACNQGAADSHEPWLAFVNPDCLPEADALARLRALASTLHEPLLGADLVDEAGIRDAAARRHDPDFAAMLRGLLSGQGLRSTAHAMALAPDDGVALQPVEVVSGALMLMPRSLFERIGGFDERYRLHAEDLDLCRRARAAGATLAVANRVSVVHVRGVSSRSRPVFVEWHKHRGLWRYFRTFEAPRRGLAMRAAVFATIWLRFPVAVLRALLR